MNLEYIGLFSLIHPSFPLMVSFSKESSAEPGHLISPLEDLIKGREPSIASNVV